MISSVMVLRPGVGGIVVPAGEQVNLVGGDALHVSISFSYNTSSAGTCTIVGYIGSITNPVAKGTEKVSLYPTTDFTSKQASVDIKIPSGGLFGGLAGGTYNLGVYIKDTELYQEIPDCVVIQGTGGISDMIGMIIMVMMMSMIMPMMNET